MSYKHDVFLSYSRDYPFGDWVKETFLPLFRGLLKGAINHEPDIFIDDSIDSGNAWNEKLKNALAHSKCLVGIWSPHYFLSEWCKSECAVMLHRESIFNLRSIDKPEGLIVPVSVQDGDKFPEYAKDIQYKNWQNFARVGKGFRDSPRYTDFQDKMIDWVEEVARAIENAPDWDPNWKERNWFENTVPSWSEYSKIKMIDAGKSVFSPPSLA